MWSRCFTTNAEESPSKMRSVMVCNSSLLARPQISPVAARSCSELILKLRALRYTWCMMTSVHFSPKTSATFYFFRHVEYLMQHNLPRTNTEASEEVKLVQSAHLLITVYVKHFPLPCTTLDTVLYRRLAYICTQHGTKYYTARIDYVCNEHLPGRLPYKYLLLSRMIMYNAYNF